jgi:hypothetical protein
MCLREPAMKRLVRRKTLPDGRVEIFTPKMTDGYYTLADRVVDPKKHNTAANQFFVRDIDAVIARLRRGGVSLRMRGDITGQENLLSAGAIDVEEDAAASGVAEDDDPFATFTEWSSAADDAAYKSL